MAVRGDWIYPVGLRSMTKSWKPDMIRFLSRRQSCTQSGSDGLVWTRRGKASSTPPFSLMIFSFESPKRVKKCLGWRRQELDRAPHPLFLFHPMVASETRIGSRVRHLSRWVWQGGLTLHTDDPRCSVDRQGSVGALEAS